MMSYSVKFNSLSKNLEYTGHIVSIKNGYLELNNCASLFCLKPENKSPLQDLLKSAEKRHLPVTICVDIHNNTILQATLAEMEEGSFFM